MPKLKYRNLYFDITGAIPKYDLRKWKWKPKIEENWNFEQNLRPKIVELTFLKQIIADYYRESENERTNLRVLDYYWNKVIWSSFDKNNELPFL